MNDLFIIIKKELTELLRDKKTIINSIVLPTVLVPILIFGAMKVTELIEKQQQEKTVKIGLVNAPSEFSALIAADTLNKVTTYDKVEDFKALIEDESIATAIVFPADWDSQMESLNTGEVQIFRNGSKENVNKRASKLIETYNAKLKEERIAILNIPTQKMKPFTENYIEVGEQKEVIGKKIGGFIPYLFILTMWGGCLLAAVDLVTGEKERKTIETTLSLPISKFKVLFGKAIVASLLGFIPALLNLIGLIIGLKLFNGIPDSFKSVISEMLNFQSISLILLLLIPFALFLSGFIIALVASATSFKEAQSKASPLIMLIIIPLVLAMMPGIELNWTTVLIPVLNIGLGVKEIMAGTIDMVQYVVILVSLIAFAVAAVYFSYKKFSDENAILK
ncbi:putative ABC-type Na+ efflux pump, permease component [Cellulophaga algicola DSM 14237]|uniref:ABC-type Na+ efflux pump, permease component n=1 Tax=Cellulophaga algicola (strain DSM 14237 / IC166 / ACAM 630) TaxID=688270 RepID=E6X4P1_CELAD|nr:ABC transporter permease [Cellulophaga algicola]ADV49366.1 putative ABC-type Na+ efflux pump, permease component [Cellulophaga algicola DSM 14237]